MSLAPELERAYLEEFQAARETHALGDWLPSVPETAMDRFRSVGIPPADDDAWRDFDLRLLRKVPFRLERGLDTDVVNDAPALDWVRGTLLEQSPHLICINGVFQPALSAAAADDDGFQAGSLRQMAMQRPQWLARHWSRLLETSDAAFDALNTAFVRDGVVLRVPSGVRVAQPIRVTFVSTGLVDHQVIHPRLLVVAESGSAVEVIETHVGRGSGVYWSNAVCELFVEEGASVRHVTDTREGDRAIVVGALRVDQAAKSRVDAVRLVLGGGLVRNDVTADLNGQGAELALAGLFLGSERQHLDHRVWVRHRAPETKSAQLMKGVLGGHATGSFLGRVVVAQDAQRIRAHQTSRNLLLSRRATAKAKPQLEIYADDVRCTHAATTGKLDEDAWFYLQSRGFDPQAARTQLILGFLNEVTDGVAWPEYRAALASHLAERLPAISCSGGDDA